MNARPGNQSLVIMEVNPEKLASKQTRIPYRAISFMAESGKQAAKLGVRKGLSKTAAKVSGPLIVLEAIGSVIDCISSFIELSRAREVRKGLQKENPLLIKKLATERDQLRDNLDVAKKKLTTSSKKRETIAKLVKECQSLFSMSMEAFHAVRTADLPDLDRLAEIEDQVIDRWNAFKHTLELYQRS